MVIAEYARLPAREAEVGTEDIAWRMGVTASAVRHTMTRLARAGLDVRVPIGVDKFDRPVYAYRGRFPRYRLPAFPAPDDCPCAACLRQPEGGPNEPPLKGGRNEPPSTPSEPEGGTKWPEGGTNEPGRWAHGATPPVSGDPVAAAAAAVPTDDEDPDVAAVAARLGIELASAAQIVAKVKRTRRPDNLGGYLRAVPDDDLRRMLPASERLRARPAQSTVPPLCGECDARPGDPPSARLVWLDAEHSSSAPCPRCSLQAVTGVSA